MRITIDTDILKKEGIGLDEFLMLLMAFLDFNYKKTLNKLKLSHLLAPNLFEIGKLTFSDNTRKQVSRILVSSSPKVMSSGIHFYDLAKKMRDLFPDGCKEGTSYPWKSDVDDVAFNLMLLFCKYDFNFTEQEALDATKKYLDCFKESKKYMQLLKYFILKTHKPKDDNDDRGFTSMFMTMIENNRNNEKQIGDKHENSD